MVISPATVRGAATPAVSARSVGHTSLWYKDAIFYELHVRAFRDSNGDGIGDFTGLTEKLDYLEALGVTTLWLLPFYPSPLKDDGYDIADYVNVHPDYGTLDDFRIFLREAHGRGLRVVTELVLNHTSDQHAWFQRARRAEPGTAERDFYVWSKSPDLYSDARIIFKDFELSNWTWDPLARAYYWHRFYSHQPDLNYRNPQVVQAMVDAVDFWLDLGVDGLRLDAVPYLAEAENTSSENLPETHRILKDLRRHIDEKYVDRMLLAEANQWPEAAAEYFGDGDECHMAFHFPLMPRLFMALRQEDSFPILDIISQTPDIPDNSQWALFLRNHDELTLEMVTEEERLFMWHAYARDPEARINLGIRRRLAPLLGNDRRRIELMNALLLSMPGTPVLYYGDEIGMGDNIYLGDRNGVRTPMQWGPGLNAGFSESNPQRLYLPLIVDPAYHHITVQVESQERNPMSLLNWMRRLLGLRQRYKAFGRGTLEFLDTDKSQVIAYLRRYEDQTLLVAANLSRFTQHFGVELAEHDGKTPFDLFGRTPFPAVGRGTYPLVLGPHGFLWLSLETSPRDAEVSSPGDYEAPVIALREISAQALFSSERSQLEQALPAFLRSQRWFRGEGKTVLGCSAQNVIPVPGEDGGRDLYLLTVRLEFNTGDPERYTLPVCLDRTGGAQRPEEAGAVIVWLALAGAAGGDGAGREAAALRDAAYDPLLIKAMLGLILQPEPSGAQRPGLQAVQTPKLEALLDLDLASAPVRRANAPGNNIVAVVGERAVVKIFRRAQEGVNPDLEMTLYLSESGYEHSPSIAGAVQKTSRFHESITVAVAQHYSDHQSTLWEHSMAEFAGFLERARAVGEALAPTPIDHASIARGSAGRVPGAARDLIGNYLNEIALLGQRLAEMHHVLASDLEHATFAPERFTGFYQRSLYQRFRSLTVRTFGRLAANRNPLPPSVSERVSALLERREDVLAEFEPLRERPLEALRIRCHGNLHLEDVLPVGNDFMFVDFEGEATLPLYERRLKASPLTDVVSLMRSLFYVPQAFLLDQPVSDFASDRPAALQAAVRYWQHWTAVALLKSYRQSAKRTNALPGGGDFNTLLAVLLTARTMYELAYELAHRPHWLPIPLDDALEALPKSQAQR